MDWEECIRSYDVKETPKNNEIAKSFLKLVDARLEVANSMDKKKHQALLCEAYYEIIKELIISLISIKGFKSYSHVCLISFIREFHSSKFSGNEIEIMDKLRKIRNDLHYRGIFTGVDFMSRNEKRIIKIISRLKELVETKVI
jgi:hypothetical protein